MFGDGLRVCDLTLLFIVGESHLSVSYLSGDWIVAVCEERLRVV